MINKERLVRTASSYQEKRAMQEAETKAEVNQRIKVREKTYNRIMDDFRSMRDVLIKTGQDSVSLDFDCRLRSGRGGCIAMEIGRERVMLKKFLWSWSDAFGEGFARGVRLCVDDGPKDYIGYNDVYKYRSCPILEEFIDSWGELESVIDAEFEKVLINRIGKENYEIELQYQDGGGCYYGHCDMTDIEYDDQKKEVILA